MKKSYLILIAFLSGCSSSYPVACHHWTEEEKAQLKKADEGLSQNSPLHGMVKDYEGICEVIG